MVDLLSIMKPSGRWRLPAAVAVSLVSAAYGELAGGGVTRERSLGEDGSCSGDLVRGKSIPPTVVLGSVDVEEEVLRHVRNSDLSGSGTYELRESASVGRGFRSLVHAREDIPPDGDLPWHCRCRAGTNMHYTVVVLAVNRP